MMVQEIKEISLFRQKASGNLLTYGELDYGRRSAIYFRSFGSLSYCT